MKLFEPLDINGMVLPNRIVVPAMVTRLSGEDGVVNDDHRPLRALRPGRRRAHRGRGDGRHRAKSGPLLRISDDEFMPGPHRPARASTTCRPSKVVPQIIHFLKIARSGWRQTVDMLSHDDIDEIVEAYGAAAARARRPASTASSCTWRTPTRCRRSSRARIRARRVRRHAREPPAPDRPRDGAVAPRGRDDFPVGVRFLAEECIKDGYTVLDAKPIALRLAELGADYLSLSAGGKFEDAIHLPGQPPTLTPATPATAACPAPYPKVPTRILRGDQGLCEGARLRHAGRDHRQDFRARRRRGGPRRRQGRPRRDRARAARRSRLAEQGARGRARPHRPLRSTAMCASISTAPTCG